MNRNTDTVSKDFLDRVCLGKLNQYCDIIRMKSKFLHCATLFAELDHCRARVHDELLAQAGMGRDDEDFAFWLATVSETIVELPAINEQFVCPRQAYCGLCKKERAA